MNKAKQFVVLQPGRLRDRRRASSSSSTRTGVSLVGRPSAHNWVQYHGETGGYDVTFERDERDRRQPDRASGSSTASRCRARTRCRCSRRRTAGRCPEIKFFNMGEITIAGHTVRALHHGMSGVARPGAVRAVGGGRGRPRGASSRPGEDFGLRQVGSRVYATNTLESGWIPCPLPAVFTGDDLKAYREWLPGERLRGDRLARRQLLLGRHRRLLPDPARPRLLAVRQVRPRLRRPRGARGDGRRGRRGGR